MHKIKLLSFSLMEKTLEVLKLRKKKLSKNDNNVFNGYIFSDF